MARRFLQFIALLFVVTTLYAIWAYTGRQYTFDKSYAGKIEMQEFGADSGRGNIVSIQPYMYPGDYTSEKTFYTAIDRYIHRAALKGWLHKNTVVSLPEYLGTWLVVAGEKRSVFEAKTVHEAMSQMVLSNPWRFLKKYYTGNASDKSADAIFRMKAQNMASIYNHVFSSLAKQYGVTIVAGSIVLPCAEIKDGALTVHDGNLNNICVIYKPDGTADDNIIKKAYPVADELPFTCKASADNIPVYNTPAGKMAVLICADSWYPDCYKQSVKEHADFVIVPSYVEGNGAFKQPWPGYSGFDNPADIDKSDIGKITILDGWVRYALPGRMKQAGLQNGIITYLHGQFWDLGSDAHYVLVSHGETIVKQPNADASVVNLWL
jgi:carbon-nitrogen hydrolase